MSTILALCTKTTFMKLPFYLREINCDYGMVGVSSPLPICELPLDVKVIELINQI